MRSVQQGLKDEGFAVPMTKLCRWFEVARRTTYLQAHPSAGEAQGRASRADQGNDRGRALVWLPHRGRAA